MNELSHYFSTLLALGPNDTLSLGQFLLAMGLAYLGGIAASLTPCVYPMIPITVSVIGGLRHLRGPQAKTFTWEVYFRGIAYVLGMTLVYSFLGVIAGMSGKVFGSLTNNAGWYLALGGIMTVAALMMLDVIQIDLVVLWENVKARLFSKKKRSSIDLKTREEEMSLIGAFILGASSGIIAAPCTTPVLTAILAYIARTQSVGIGFGLMFFFSLGLGTILLIVSIFTGIIQRMPRSGRWMHFVKIFSGIILLIFAEYLIFRAGSAGGLH
jgi:cytochrome c-type biogenesis protein